VTRRGGRRRKQVLNDLKEKRYSCTLKEALVRHLWRNCFWRGYGNLIRQTKEWILIYNSISYLNVKKTPASLSNAQQQRLCLSWRFWAIWLKWAFHQYVLRHAEVFLPVRIYKLGLCYCGIHNGTSCIVSPRRYGIQWTNWRLNLEQHRIKLWDRDWFVLYSKIYDNLIKKLIFSQKYICQFLYRPIPGRVSIYVSV
jgi:hypothetical protein